ncbi:glycosyl transferase [Bradyrhizobium murdochi]|uniref:glycosyl transferase n=1 Tax=Bradyrhizobium murdochi TaxID=1038859 RepID=UPI0004891B37|nr:glycosyl transferase [Bradyrhizobium murdochi]
MANSQLLLSFAAAVLAALLSAVLTWALRPLLLRIALAKPNARSSHGIPTPQGAGIAVIMATLITTVAVIVFAGAAEMKIPVAVFAATLFIGAVGIADDVKSIPVLPRLLLQGLAVAAVILAAPENLRIVPACPLWLERGLLILAGLWFVNLVNFMDGLDLMTVAEIVPITGALVLLGWLGGLPASTTVAAAALFGAMLGFAPFNRPVAKIFLGDVGSLPIGLLVGWCLLQLAWHQQVAAALLLPLYYLADATVTLFRRIARGEPFWAAHRSHFYQRATDNGFSVSRVVSEVFALNILLAAFAIGSVMTSSTAIAILLFVAGGIVTAFLMHRFSRRRPSPG